MTCEICKGKCKGHPIVIDGRKVVEAIEERQAKGGWEGLHGPEEVMLGERGPEYVRLAGTKKGKKS